MTQTVEALRTLRLVLRQFEEGDEAAFFELNSDPEVMAFLGGPLSRESSDSLAAGIAEKIAKQGWGFWAVEVSRDRSFAGFVGLNRPDYETEFTPCLEVGWRLGRQHWGRGYATEAGSAALEFAFTRLDDQEVVSFTTVENRRSRRVMERLGMERDVAGDFDHPKVSRGDPLKRHVLYRLSKRRWQELHAV
jgi:ribosomal-protein-alanine N-acetyltransferase